MTGAVPPKAAVRGGGGTASTPGAVPPKAAVRDGGGTASTPGAASGRASERHIGFIQDLSAFRDDISGVPDLPEPRALRLEVALCFLEVLEFAAQHFDEDPFPALGAALADSRALFEKIPRLTVRPFPVPESPGESRVPTLFETAWTGYSAATYEHSVELIRKRLRANGLDSDFFRGKRCFDGGCGTARFTIAMAEFGAKTAVGADAGRKSLSFARERATERGLGNVELVEADVTDLSRWEDSSFDFVVSNGVLHHTENPLGGLGEHLRILKSGGILWLYLYGDGGLYWTVYDLLRDIVHGISLDEAVAFLRRRSCREGLIYTFLDNVFCPVRSYHSTPAVMDFLARKISGVSFQNARGETAFDDTEKLLETKFGRELYGPEGEVRILIRKP